jgi:hypothetical protein
MIDLSDREAAATLAARLEQQQAAIGLAVATSLLLRYPELAGALRTQFPSPEARLSEVAVERLCQLMRAVLLFRQPALAEQELAWAWGVLPRSGVRPEHQDEMFRLFFAALRRLALSPPEARLVDALEPYLLARIPRTATGVKPR